MHIYLNSYTCTYIYPYAPPLCALLLDVTCEEFEAFVACSSPKIDALPSLLASLFVSLGVSLEVTSRKVKLEASTSMTLSFV